MSISRSLGWHRDQGGGGRGRKPPHNSRSDTPNLKVGGSIFQGSPGDPGSLRQECSRWPFPPAHRGKGYSRGPSGGQSCPLFPCLSRKRQSGGGCGSLFPLPVKEKASIEPSRARQRPRMTPPEHAKSPDCLFPLPVGEKAHSDFKTSPKTPPPWGSRFERFQAAGTAFSSTGRGVLSISRPLGWHRGQGGGGRGR